MAKDDYDVIVCKVLVFFYRRLKGKIPDDEAASYLNPVTKLYYGVKMPYSITQYGKWWMTYPYLLQLIEFRRKRGE